MQVWIDQRAVKLLNDLNALPFTDDHDLKRLGLLKRALREASYEIFRRAAERTVADLISEEVMADSPLGKPE
jgi:hypothetical protein